MLKANALYVFLYWPIINNYPMNKQVFLGNKSVLNNNDVITPNDDINTDNSVESINNIFNYENFQSMNPIPRNERIIKNKAQKLYTVALQNQFFKSLIAWYGVTFYRR